MPALAKLGLPRFLAFQNFFWPFLLLGMVLAGLLIVVLKLPIQTALIVDGVIVVVAGVGVWLWLASIARRKVSVPYHAFQQTLAKAAVSATRAATGPRRPSKSARSRSNERRTETNKKADQKHARTNSELELWRIAETKKCDEKFKVLNAAILARRDEGIAQAEAKYPKRLAEIKERYQSDSEKLELRNAIRGRRPRNSTTRPGLP